MHVAVLLALVSSLVTTQPVLAQGALARSRGRGRTGHGLRSGHGMGPATATRCSRRRSCGATPSLALEGDLATSWELSDDRLTWRITLRDDCAILGWYGPDGRRCRLYLQYRARFGRARRSERPQKRPARAVRTRSSCICASRGSPSSVTSSRSGSCRRPPTARAMPARRWGRGRSKMVEWREGEQLVVEPNPHWHGGDIPFDRISFVFGGEGDPTCRSPGPGGRRIWWRCRPRKADFMAPAGMRALNVETVDNRRADCFRWCG